MKNFFIILLMSCAHLLSKGVHACLPLPNDDDKPVSPSKLRVDPYGNEYYENNDTIYCINKSTSTIYTFKKLESGKYASTGLESDESKWKAWSLSGDALKNRKLTEQD